MADNGRYPWMKFFPKNFVADTVGLSTDEIGAYAMLICRAWDANGRLPFDTEYLSRITGSKPAIVQSLIKRLSPFRLLYEDDGFLRVQMVDRDLERVENVRSTRSNAGKRSAENRRLRIVGGGEE
jgi:uncharacterized protein YdaU (DUF1376 family)